MIKTIRNYWIDCKIKKIRKLIDEKYDELWDIQLRMNKNRRNKSDIADWNNDD